MARGGYEDKTHEELYAMVSNAKPEQLSSRGNALLDAADDILRIGEDLMSYLERVEWEGEGGNSFRNWSREFAKEALRLGSYARGVGSGMVNAGQGLSEVKAAMPKPIPDAFGTKKVRPPLVDKDEQSRQEAIYQVERLESYYLTTSADLRAPEEPNFKPLGGAFLPPGAAQPAPTSTGNAATAGGAAFGSVNSGGTSAGGAIPTGSTSAGASATTSSVAPLPVPEAAMGTTLDSVATAPPEQRSNVGPASSLPSAASSGPSGPVGTPVAPTPVSPIRSTGIPQGTPMGRAPGGTSAPRATTPPRAAGSNGIYGGTPRPTSMAPRPSGMPQGTVVGGERAPYGRPVSGGHYGGAGGRAYSSGQQDNAGRFARQSGGVAGGAQTARTGRGEFTPGGSGLVRGVNTSAPAPRAAGRTTPDNRRRDENRPEYLAEDPGTWRNDRRDIVPPVIE